MKSLTWFLLALLSVAPAYAKPKVNVRVKVNEAFSKDQIVGKFSNGGATAQQMYTQTVWYMNVTVGSENAEAVAKNNGEWCLSGDVTLDKDGEYQGTLDGNSIEVQVPGKNGKPKNLRLEVFDRKWRKPSDLN